MTEFEFGDPPPGKGGRMSDPVIVEFAALLRQRPGQWAKWPTPLKPSTLRCYASMIRKGMLKPFRGGGYDAVMRDGELYVQFVGGE